MWNHRHYVPILKTKLGEFNALGEVNVGDRQDITPLFDVVRVRPNRSKNGVPTRELGEHLSAKASKILEKWEGMAFVDLFDIDLASRVAGGEHPVEYMFDLLRDSNVEAVPCTGIDRDDDHWKAVRLVAKKDGRGVCVRILEEDMISHGQLRADLKKLSEALNISLEELHLVMDFREIRPRRMALYSKLALGILRNLEGISKLASITVAGSSMPQTLGDVVKAGHDGEIERLEWRLWRSVISEQNLHRRPSFGDYGIVHPDYLDLDPKKISIAPTIRYTTSNTWLLLRGVSTKKKGFRQFHDLSRKLVARPEYQGMQWSWGDKYIHENASRSERPGSATTWVGVGTNHHLALVSRAIVKTS